MGTSENCNIVVLPVPPNRQCDGNATSCVHGVLPDEQTWRAAVDAHRARVSAPEVAPEHVLFSQLDQPRQFSPHVQKSASSISTRPGRQPWARCLTTLGQRLALAGALSCFHIFLYCCKGWAVVRRFPGTGHRQWERRPRFF